MWSFVLTVTRPSLIYFYNQVIGTYIESALSLEAIMGNSLHNKIYLGRRVGLHSRGTVALMCIGAAAGLALVLLALRTFK